MPEIQSALQVKAVFGSPFVNESQFDMSKLTFSILVAVSFCWFGLNSNAAEKPNILYIVADDLGWKDVGFHGSADIKTPNLDKLAAEGARLEQFYVQPFCTPSRAALMTGRYPFRYGLQTIVIPSKGTYGLSTDEYLLPQVLKDSGYYTAMVGKWHLGHADQKYWPRQRGFDYHYGAVLGEIDYFTHSAHDVLDWQRNNKAVHEKGYVTQLLGKDAVRVIEEDDGKKPLFLYLAFTAPHTPYQAPPEYVNRFKNIGDETRRVYVAMIACLDDEIGHVLAALDKKKMRDNTLIVFHSDNGGTRDARVTGEGNVKNVPCDNGPLKGGKSQLYEGGTRVPAFATWPGHIQPGEVKELIHVVDMLPTLANIADASIAKSKSLDGRDVWSAIAAGKSSGRTEIVYNVEPFRGAVRQGDWKLVWISMLPSRLELYDLLDDPNETTNLADQQPEKVKELQARLEQLAKESAKPLFFETAAKALFSGIFGPAPIPTEDDPASVEP
jgi:arylsulfatase A-like enzyme